MIIDYSVARPPVTLLKTAGVTAVGRYIGADCEPGFNCIHKNITRPEATALLAAGIQIFISLEYDARAALGGAAQGTKDGQLAARQLTALGAPHGMTIYYALDFDIADFAPASNDPRAKLGPAAHYLDAINALHLPWKTGVYGGYYAVKRCLDAGLASMGWQTVAWSGGQWDNRAVLRQLASQWQGFADIDLHTASGPDFGQWPRPVPPPPHGPYMQIADGTQSLAQIAAARGTTEAHLVTESVTGPGYPAALTRKPLLKGMPYWTSNP